MNYTGFNIGSVSEFFIIPLTKITQFIQLSKTDVSFSIDNSFVLETFIFSKDSAEPRPEYKDQKYGFTPNGDFVFSIPKVSKMTSEKINDLIGIPIIIYLKLLNQENFVLGSPDFPLRIESIKTLVPAKTAQATFFDINFSGNGSELLSATII